MLLPIEKRTIDMAKYIIKHNCTVREAASVFGVSKSTVHKDISIRLCELDTYLCEKVRLILDKNKRERHIRGGQATKKKYKCNSK